MQQHPELRASPLALPSAFADAALLAVRRSLALHATLMQDCLELGLARARRAATDPVGAMRESMLSPALAEPVWRWAGGLAAIGPQALLTWAAAASPDPSRVEPADAPRTAPDATVRRVGDAARAAWTATADATAGAADGAAADDRSARPVAAHAALPAANADANGSRARPTARAAAKARSTRGAARAPRNGTGTTRGSRTAGGGRRAATSKRP